MEQWREWVGPVMALGAAIVLIVLTAYAVAPGHQVAAHNGLAELPGFQVLSLS